MPCFQETTDGSIINIPCQPRVYLCLRRLRERRKGEKLIELLYLFITRWKSGVSLANFDPLQLESVGGVLG